MNPTRRHAERRELSHQHSAVRSEATADELERAVGSLATADDLEREVVHPFRKPRTQDQRLVTQGAFS